MRFNMVRPCPHCPFRSDNPPFLHKERAKEIAQAFKEGNWFACHQTTVYREDEETGDGDMECTDSSEHCAGAMILLEKIGWPSQAMQLSERLGNLGCLGDDFYRPERLEMTAPVYDSLETFVQVHEPSRKRRASRPTR